MCVFNFYKPDHQPVGPLTGTGLVAPEFEILTSVSVNEFQNLLTDAVARRRLSPRRLNSRSTDVKLDFGELFDVIRLDSHQAFRSEGIDAALAYLDILLCHGTLSEETKQTIKSAILRTLPTSTGSRRRQALIAMVSLVLTSPDCAIVD